MLLVLVHTFTPFVFFAHTDAFYEAADEQGILIWQEFAFACALYPRPPSFLADIGVEAHQQVARLSSHPSVALWGGNNEVETSFGWFPESIANPQLYAVDYDALFVRLLRDVVLGIDPGAIYIDSSPSNGVYNTTATIIKRWGDASDLSRGDIHFYDYTSNLLDSAAYPLAKFVSEFGYMSIPSFSSWIKQSNDLGVAGGDLEARMRHGQGMQQIKDQLKMHFFNLNVASSSSSLATTQEEDMFQDFIYLTQLQQSLIYETAAIAWRRARADVEAATAGLLYWQLNDVWAGPSWSSINFDGQWKLLHYAARRFFRPIAVFGVVFRDAGDVLEVWGVQDAPHRARGALTVELIPYQAVAASEVRTVVAGMDVEIPGSNASLLYRGRVADAVGTTNGELKKHYMIRSEFCSNYGGGGGGDCVEHYVMLTEPTDAQLASNVTVDVSVAEVGRRGGVLLQTPANEGEDGNHNDDAHSRSLLQASSYRYKKQGERVVEVTLTSTGGIAVYLSIEFSLNATPCVCSDNVLMLMPWKPIQLECVLLDNSITARPPSHDNAALQRSFRLTWLQSPHHNDTSTKFSMPASSTRKAVHRTTSCTVTYMTTLFISSLCLFVVTELVLE